MKTILLIIFYFITLNAQSRIIPFSGNPVPAPAGEDSLKLYYLFSDLTNGDVTSGEWVDNIVSLALTATSDPNKNDTAVTFDTNDDVYDNGVPFTVTGALSLELVVFLPDTVTTPQGIFAYAKGKSLSFTLRDNYINATGYDNSSLYYADCWSTPFWNRWNHVIITYGGSTADPKIYLDGVLQTNQTGINGGVQADDDRIIFGYVSGGVANNTAVKLMKVIHKELSQGEITAKYNSALIQGLLP